MSALKNLAEKITPSKNTALRNHPDAIAFTSIVPVITKEDCLAHMSNQHIKSIILTHGDIQNRRTNVKASMTSWWIHKNETIFAELCAQAIELAEKNGPHKIGMETSECWGALYREGDFTLTHDHWPNLWSWVYNVESCSECSPLKFQTQYHTHEIPPKEGNMILFPAWILHSVPTHTCKHDRIVVAGNIKHTK